MEKQSFNIQADLLQAQFPGLFKNFIFILILLFGLLILVNLFTGIFTKSKQTSPKDYIVLLIIVLNKVFLLGGIGFIAANIVKKIFEEIGRNNSPNFNISGAWEDLSFGIILLFIGFGFKKTRKIINQHIQPAPINTEEQLK